MKINFNKQIVLILVAIISFGKLYSQQDAMFSQYLFHGLYINPAYAGYKGHTNMNANYRNQWVGFPGAPKTFSLALDGTTHNERVGVGMHIVNDRIGIHNNTAMYGTYAYRFPIGGSNSNAKLSLGLSAGFVQSKIDKTKLDPISKDDNVLINLKGTTITPDARFGAFYHTDRFFAGVSADNLLSQSFSKRKDQLNILPNRKIHLYATAGGLVALSENVLFRPSFLLKDDLAGPTNLDINSFFLLSNKIWIGGTYRTAVPLYSKPHLDKNLTKRSSLVGMTEIFLGENLRLGYSYDHTILAPVLHKNPTHEISVGYFFAPTKVRLLSPRFF